MLNYISLARRLGILVILLACFGFVLFSNNTQNVLARPCCNECELDPFGDVGQYTYCEAECGATNYSCVQSCLNRVYACWSYCDYSCGWGGGWGSACNSNSDCDYWAGEFCTNGTCQYASYTGTCAGVTCPAGYKCKLIGAWATCEPCAPGGPCP